MRTGVITSHASEPPLSQVLDSVCTINVPSKNNTTFRNTYIGNQRQQQLLATARRLEYHDIPEAWREAPVILLGPVARELGDSLFTNAYTGSLVGLTPQGMMRAWDKDGIVRAVRWTKADDLLQNVDAVILSMEDLASPDELNRYIRRVPIVVVTRNRQGATVYESGKERSFPAFECEVKDPTGAGDVFAAAFLIELNQSGSIAKAADFANCAASFIIEGPGSSSLPTRDNIEARLQGAHYLPQ